MSLIKFPPLLQLLPLKSHTTVFSSTSSLRPGLHQFTSIFAGNNIYYREECNKKQPHKHILILQLAIERDFEARVQLHPVCTELTYPMLGKEWFLMGYANSRGVLDMMETTKSYRNTGHFTGASRNKPPIPINCHSKNRPCGRFLMAKTDSTGQGPFALEFTYP